MGIGKSATTNTASTTSANPQAAAAYSSLLNQAQGVASTPYQAYTGELTAPVNSQQQQGIAGINASANQAQPSIQQALGIAGGAANPLTAAQIQQYQNPYTQDVVNATQNQFNENNQQQQEALTGNTIASGALGGNRAGIAANNLSTQQATAQNPVIAGLYSNSYNSGLATANQQFQTNPLAAAGSIANFGVAGQTAAQSGAGAQLGAGTVEQQTQQATDTANQAAYAQQQAYPFQTAQWLAGIDTGVGSALGSSSTGTTTAPAPNTTAQYAGLGLAAASFLARGGRVGYADGGEVRSDEDPQGIATGQQYAQSSPYQIRPNQDGTHSVINVRTGQIHFTGSPSGASNAQASLNYRNRASGGPVQRMGVGGTPWSNAPTWVPTFSGTHGVAPHAGSTPSAQQPAAPTFDYGKIVSANNKDDSPGLLSNLTGGTAQQNAADDLQDDLADGSAYYGAPETAGGIYRSGGVVRGYADGGAPDDVFGDDNRAIAYDLLRKREGITAPDAIPGGEPAPSQGVAPAVWNPDQPYRMPDQAATDDWRAGHPIPPLGTPPTPPSDDDTDLPPEITSGATRAPKGVVAPSDDGSEALGYAGRPNAAPTTPSAGVAAAAAPDDNGGGLGLLHLSRNARSGLLAAGLGMLASRSSNFGNALGEGGLHGLTAYSAGEERDRKAADEAAKLSREAQNHAEEMKLKTDTQKETVRHNHATEDKEYKPSWGVISESADPDTGLSRKTYGWIDPNKKAITDSSGKPIVTSSSPTPPAVTGTSNPDAQGDDFLKAVPPARALRAKMIGDYEESPSDLPTRGGVRATAVADAKKYNKDYNEQNYPASQRAYNNFSGGPEARTVRSLNVATDHLDTLRQAAVELKNGNIPAVNNLVNHYREMTGSPLTTNFDSIKQAVSSEIAKTIVGGQTALQDRDEMSNRARNADSPDQLYGIFDQFTKLMGGQMKGLRQQYESTTYRKDFDKYLLPSTKKAIDAVSKDVQGTYERPSAPQNAIDMLKKNPALAPQFDQKYGADASRQYLGQ